MADGRTVVVRELTAADAAALVAAVEAATPADLQRRFLGPPPTASFLTTRLAAADGTHHAHVGAFSADGTLVGAAQFDRSDDAQHAEIAVQVATEWQHDGVGTVLLRHLAVLARRRGISTFTATYLGDNVALRRLLGHLGLPVSATCHHGEGHAIVVLGDALHR